MIRSDKATRMFRALWAAFLVQVAGRLLDLQWHLTHNEFETGRDQLQAHWLMWLGTLFAIVVALIALQSQVSGPERRGYLVSLGANVLYAVVAVIHFVQHLNHQEVDWAHISLAVTNIAAVVGVLMVTASRFRAAREAEITR